MQTDWIEHRRAEDGERVGWLQPHGEGFIPIDLLGRPVSDTVDWLSAEEILDALGLAYLAEPHELRLENGTWLRVRIAEVLLDSLRVKKDDWGDMTARQVYYRVTLPIDETKFRQLRR